MTDPIWLWSFRHSIGSDTGYIVSSEPTSGKQLTACLYWYSKNTSKVKIHWITPLFQKFHKDFQSATLSFTRLSSIFKKIL